jgi:hypothetical protein
LEKIAITLYFKVLFMQREDKDISLETLQEIRLIMERSARFLSLSGWSGVWAGVTALAAAYIANNMMEKHIGEDIFPNIPYANYILLGAATFIIALAGAWIFTAQKAKRQGQKIWNGISRKLAWQIAVPMLAGGFFIYAFITYGDASLVAPACLCFYGLALINGSKYTLPDILTLGYAEVVLGCLNIFYPGYGIYFLGFGFGILHIAYGITMWNRYDRNQNN